MALANLDFERRVGQGFHHRPLDGDHLILGNGGTSCRRFISREKNTALSCVMLDDNRRVRALQALAQVRIGNSGIARLQQENYAGAAAVRFPHLDGI